MTPADFPIFFQLLVADDQFERTYSKAWIERTERAITILDEAILAGSIANPVFKDVKDRLNRSMEDAWRRIDRPGFGFGGTKRMVPDAVYDACDAYRSTTAHGFANTLRRVEACPDHPVRTACLDYLREIKPLVDGINSLKDKTVKRQPKTEEARRAERFQAPISTSNAVATVNTLLRQIVDGHFAALKQSLIDRNLRIIDGFLAKQEEADKDPTLMGEVFRGRLADYYAIQHHCTTKVQGREMVDQERHMLLMRTFRVERVGPNLDKREILQADGRQYAIDDATKHAEELRDYFVVKNLRKIVSILEGKGDDLFLDAKIIGSTLRLSSMEGTIKFTFRDGGEFTAKNSVVWSTSVHGKRFARFPLTFHDVKLAGGTAMKSPSEERMNTVFLGKAA